MQSPLPFADFPEDVTRSVLEIAAATGNWSCALLSKEVKAFAEPLLYRRIELVYSSKEKLGLLHRTVSEHPSKEEGFFATYVKTLVFLRVDINPDHASAIFEACRGVKKLVYIPDDNTVQPGSAYNTDSHSFLSQVTHCAPTDVLVWSKGLADDQRGLTSPIFQNVTHLSVVMLCELGWDWDWDALQSLKNLTHLCINDIGSDMTHEHVVDIVVRVLPRLPPKFQVLVIHTSGIDERIGLASAGYLRQLDSRIVITCSNKTSDWFGESFMNIVIPFFYCSASDFTTGSLSGGDFWRRAENALHPDTEIEQVCEEEERKTLQKIMKLFSHILARIWGSMDAANATPRDIFNKYRDILGPIPEDMPQFWVDMLEEVGHSRWRFTSGGLTYDGEADSGGTAGRDLTTEERDFNSGMLRHGLAMLTTYTSRTTSSLRRPGGPTLDTTVSWPPGLW